MKKLILICIAAGILSGCSQNEVTPTQATTIPEETTTVLAEATTASNEPTTVMEETTTAIETAPAISIESVSTVPVQEGMILYKSLSFSYNSENWSVEVYVQAESGADGEIYFDDRNMFLLKAVSPSGEYELLNEWIQLGGPEVDVLVDLDDTLHIIVQDIRSARYAVTDYVYDKENQSFSSSTQPVNHDGINYIGRADSNR